MSRSREGAWIEIDKSICVTLAYRRRSREGAWIEIPDLADGLVLTFVALVRERGLKFKRWLTAWALPCVAPVRERGLK